MFPREDAFRDLIDSIGRSGGGTITTKCDMLAPLLEIRVVRGL
jgi:hypothetical protein